MNFFLNELSAMIDGDILGDPDLEIHGVSSFDQAEGQEITFAVDPRFLKRLNKTQAGAVIIPRDYIDFDINELTCSLIRSENPKLHFFRIVAIFNPAKKTEPGISNGASIGINPVIGKDVTLSSNVTLGNDVTLGDRVHLMPGVFIGDNVVIGRDTTIKPNVTVMEKTRIGERVVIHSGSVIGSDGFGFTPNQGGHEKLIHAGFVEIEDDVEIGACNTIDRGTLGRTLLGRGVKTDNLVHIAHNVVIGENTLIVAQVGIAGSSTLGKNVIVAGRAAISGHLNVGDSAIIGPGAGVLSDVPSGEIVSGIPSMPHKLWLKVGRIIPRLPDLRKRLLALEKKVDQKEQKCCK